MSWVGLTFMLPAYPRCLEKRPFNGCLSVVDLLRIRTEMFKPFKTSPYVLSLLNNKLNFVKGCEQLSHSLGYFCLFTASTNLRDDHYKYINCWRREFWRRRRSDNNKRRQIIKSIISSQFRWRSERVHVTYCQLRRSLGARFPRRPVPPIIPIVLSRFRAVKYCRANRPQISIHDILVSFHVRWRN